MTSLRLYLDEDSLDAALIRALRNANLDVVTVSEVGRLGYSDEEQLIWATEQRRTIYSFNIGDFCRLHDQFVAQERIHAGIILATQQKYSIGQQLRGLLKIAAATSTEDMVNQLIFVNTYIRNV